MESKNKACFREEIAHMTKTEPYSIYHITFSGDNETALYLHWHPEVELYYLREGELDFYIEDVCWHLTAGDAVFVPPNLLHTAKAAGGSAGSFWALVFSAELVVSPTDTARFQKYVQPILHDNSRFGLYLSPQIEWQKAVLQDLKRIFIQTQSGSCGREMDTDLLVEGLIRVIWQSLYRFHLAKLSEHSPRGKMEEQMQTILRYIHHHFQEDISLQMLSKIVHVSEGQLCRSFKQLTGSTPFTYLKRYRIMKSCEWLKNSEKKISEICTLCGFNNVSYFNREFLRVMKVTPSVYRKESKK
ncbi:MAG: AraC family transcriptional regulator [Lachnospiraceae bacterium]|nr:AraC family transcriptional regulator [Lachnospiraceae bacterium]